MSSDAELREQLRVANERLADALMMFESEDARLSHLADVIDELAVVLRAVDALGVKLNPSMRLPTSDPLPHELDRDGPRTPVLAWQGFDRALEAVLARRDAPPIDLAALADGYQRLARAGTEGCCRTTKLGRFLRKRADPVHAVQQATQRGARDGDRSRQVHLQRVRGAVRGDPRRGPRHRLTGAGDSADSAKRAAAGERRDMGRLVYKARRSGSRRDGKVAAPNWHQRHDDDVPPLGPPTKIPLSLSGKRQRAIIEVTRFPPVLPCASAPGQCRFGALVSCKLAREVACEIPRMPAQQLLRPRR